MRTMRTIRIARQGMEISVQPQCHNVLGLVCASIAAWVVLESLRTHAGQIRAPDAGAQGVEPSCTWTGGILGSRPSITKYDQALGEGIFV